MALKHAKYHIRKQVASPGSVMTPGCRAGALGSTGGIVRGGREGVRMSFPCTPVKFISVWQNDYCKVI